MNKISLISATLVGATVTFVANTLPAAALGSFSLGTNQVTTNNANLSSGFAINVSETSAGKVNFTLTNNSLSSVTDIYFGQAPAFNNYLSFASITNGTGVQFSSTVDPNVGGGIDWKSAFTADADSPAGFNKNGVDKGESLTFTFNLVGSTQFSQLESLFNAGTLVSAFHVQSIGGDNGGSDWYSTSSSVTTQDVPEPFTIIGTAGALGFSALFQRQQAKRRNKATAKA